MINSIVVVLKDKGFIINIVNIYITIVRSFNDFVNGLEFENLHHWAENFYLF